MYLVYDQLNEAAKLQKGNEERNGKKAMGPTGIDGDLAQKRLG